MAIQLAKSLAKVFMRLFVAAAGLALALWAMLYLGFLWDMLERIYPALVSAGLERSFEAALHLWAALPHALLAIVLLLAVLITAVRPALRFVPRPPSAHRTVAVLVTAARAALRFRPRLPSGHRAVAVLVAAVRSALRFRPRLPFGHRAVAAPLH